jgi:hypothetical protein
MAMTGDPAQAIVDWLHDASPQDVALELMPAFGSAELRTSYSLEQWLFRDCSSGLDRNLQRPIKAAVLRMNHAELIFECSRDQINGNSYWSATLFGLATLAQGKDAVRQRLRESRRSLVVSP